MWQLFLDKGQLLIFTLKLLLAAPGWRDFILRSTIELMGSSVKLVFHLDGRVCEAAEVRPLHLTSGRLEFN